MRYVLPPPRPLPNFFRAKTWGLWQKKSQGKEGQAVVGAEDVQPRGNSRNAETQTQESSLVSFWTASCDSIGYHSEENKFQQNSRAAKRGVSNGGGFPIWTCPSFFVLFGTFLVFLGFSRFARGWSGDFSRFVLFLFLGLLRAPTRNSPERVRDTIWTFPEKSGRSLRFGNPPV